MRPATIIRVALLAGAVLSRVAEAQPARPSEVPLPNGAPGIGFDDLRFAPSLGLVLVPAGRSGSLDLLDPATGRVTAVPGFASKQSFGGGHGDGVTSADEGRGLLFATDRTSGELVVADPKSLRIVSRTKLSGAPDYVRWVEKTGEIWVTEPDSERIEVFALRGQTASSAGFISVKGGPESLVVDGSRGRAYTHLWDGKTVAVDLGRRSIAATWPNGCRGSRGIALDGSKGHLFAGCAEGKAVVLSVANGRTLSSATSGDGVDIIDYDQKRGLLYLPGGKSATMAIFRVSADGALSAPTVVPTAPGAHCVAAAPGGDAFVCDPAKGRLLRFR
jgi:DNA-binding beta-propeller fold protein YncE